MQNKKLRSGSIKMFIFIHKKTVKKLKKCPNTEKSRYLSIQVAITIIVQNALHLQFDKNVNGQ